MAASTPPLRAFDVASVRHPCVVLVQGGTGAGRRAVVDSLAAALTVARVDATPDEAKLFIRARADRGAPGTSGTSGTSGPWGGREARVLAFASRWRRLCGGSLSIPELLLHFPALEAAGDDELLHQRALRDAALRQAGESHAALVGGLMDRDAFLEASVFEYLAPGFQDTLRGRLLAGSEYRDAMRARLADVYKRGFGAAAHADDLDHMFARVRAAGGALLGDEAVEEAARCNRELNEVSDRVLSMYRAVLDRDADEDEVRARVADFRADAAQAELRLVRELYEGIEYHDVLKALVVETLGAGVRPRVLYEVLGAALRINGGRMFEAFGCGEEAAVKAVREAAGAGGGA